MNHYTRLREMDLAQLVQTMSNDIEDAVIKAWRASGRPQEDLFMAGPLALAVSASALRSVGGIPVGQWAEANAIANDRTSLTYQLPTLPRTLAAIKKSING